MQMKSEFGECSYILSTRRPGGSSSSSSLFNDESAPYGLFFVR